MSKRIFTVILASLGATLPSHALDYVESIDGDLTATIASNIASAATPLVFDLGVNTVSGTMGADAGEGIPLDRDFFTFTLSPGQSLTSINMLAFSHVGQSFYAIAPGTSISLVSSAGHLSNVLITGTGEYLDDLDAGAYDGGTGLTAPLGPGTYTIWFQELASQVNYSTAYTVVPEPGTTLSLLSGAATLLHLRRRRDRRA
jgi:hypothetical protein